MNHSKDISSFSYSFKVVTRAKKEKLLFDNLSNIYYLAKKKKGKWVIKPLSETARTRYNQNISDEEILLQHADKKFHKKNKLK